VKASGIERIREKHSSQMRSLAGRGGGSAIARRDAAQMQRERILKATTEVVAERGYARASVGLVVARARVSRRTFERQFGGLDDCVAAVFDLGREWTAELVTQAFAGQKNWRDGVRTALASVLTLFDGEPLLTRVWLVESLAAGDWARQQRERHVWALRDLILSSWPVSEGWSQPPLAAEGVIASVLGIVHAHIVAGKPEPLIELLGPLMGLATSPYLSPRAAAREVELGRQFAREVQAGEYASALSGARCGGLLGAHDRGGPAGQHRDDLRDTRPRRRETTRSDVEIPPALSNPNAHRARQCVLFLAEQGGRGLSPSNSEIAADIGVAHQSQISRLLAYLVDENLAVKRSTGAGRPNAWRLTPHGEEIARLL
jgi:AcrR family transcriptional regulator